MSTLFLYLFYPSRLDIGQSLLRAVLPDVSKQCSAAQKIEGPGSPWSVAPQIHTVHITIRFLYIYWDTPRTVPYVCHSVRLISIMFRQTECYIITTRRTHPYRGTCLLPSQHHSIYLLRYQRMSNTQIIQAYSCNQEDTWNNNLNLPINCAATLTTRFNSRISGHVPVFCVGSRKGSRRKWHISVSTQIQIHKATVLLNILRGRGGALTNMLHGIYPV
jgi:hypothetical protein